MKNGPGAQPGRIIPVFFHPANVLGFTERCEADAFKVARKFFEVVFRVAQNALQCLGQVAPDWAQQCGNALA
jgi:hypothetical protein